MTSLLLKKSQRTTVLSVVGWVLDVLNRFLKFQVIPITAVQMAAFKKKSSFYGLQSPAAGYGLTQPTQLNK